MHTKGSGKASVLPDWARLLAFRAVASNSSRQSIAAAGLEVVEDSSVHRARRSSSSRWWGCPSRDLHPVSFSRSTAEPVPPLRSRLVFGRRRSGSRADVETPSGQACERPTRPRRGRCGFVVVSGVTSRSIRREARELLRSCAPLAYKVWQPVHVPVLRNNLRSCRLERRSSRAASPPRRQCGSPPPPPDCAAAARHESAALMRGLSLP